MLALSFQATTNGLLGLAFGQPRGGTIEDRGEIVVPASGLRFRRATAAACQ